MIFLDIIRFIYILLIPVQLIPILEFWSIGIISGSHWRCILFTVSGHSINRIIVIVLRPSRRVTWMSATVSKLPNSYLLGLKKRHSNVAIIGRRHQVLGGDVWFHFWLTSLLPNPVSDCIDLIEPECESREFVKVSGKLLCVIAFLTFSSLVSPVLLSTGTPEPHPCCESICLWVLNHLFDSYSSNGQSQPYIRLTLTLFWWIGTTFPEGKCWSDPISGWLEMNLSSDSIGTLAHFTLKTF